jgi:hypothetical protein
MKFSNMDESFKHVWISLEGEKALQLLEKVTQSALKTCKSIVGPFGRIDLTSESDNSLSLKMDERVQLFGWIHLSSEWQQLVFEDGWKV